MSKIGEIIAWRINQLFPQLEIHRSLENAKLDISANQAWSLAEARRVVKYFDPYWNLKDKHLLDIGTGIGGKLSLYQEAGVRAITGIDITPQSVSISRQYIQDKVGPRYTAQEFYFSVADAAKMPFADNCFDAIVSINVFEHIMGVENAVSESYRVLKPGGIAFLHVPPYYGPWGPHLENWIHFPWSHLFFSDRTLLRVAEREDKRRPLNEKFMYAAQ
ncbi:MAG TPA: class I SAM-dependent methyltransferase, partial [Anaerolineales bacterium]|nr:class I SAM-dependent methyltransferase [Anaerolineales bacterium]